MQHTHEICICVKRCIWYTTIMALHLPASGNCIEHHLATRAWNLPLCPILQASHLLWIRSTDRFPISPVWRRYVATNPLPALYFPAFPQWQFESVSISAGIWGAQACDARATGASLGGLLLFCASNSEHVWHSAFIKPIFKLIVNDQSPCLKHTLFQSESKRHWAISWWYPI